ncbi:MAG TPA: DUF1080 domain-containing protein [Vicinamibacterales bacterium]|nr:DUF1080 domain-containing protein [Vicinamibacterales bacterium]
MRPLVLCALVTVSAAGAQALTPQERSDGYVSLFDGATLTNWHVVPLGATPGTWIAKGGVLTHTPGDSWLASDKTYTDFVLRLEYRTGDGSDSGIFMRSMPDGYPSFTGMEIEIKNDPTDVPSPRSNTSIYGAAAPIVNATKANGTWNVVEVSLVRRRLVAVWNGRTIHDVDLDDTAYAGALRGSLAARAASGHIGFQAHATGVPVEFRRIRIKVVR